ncbi:MAG: 30S ribosomal protein S20 [bacterium]
MPNHKSCEKRMKIAARQRLANRAQRSVLRAAIRDLRAQTNREEALKQYKDVVPLLDRAARSHLIHPRNADRNKSRLAHFVAKLA